jgi:DNA-binding response OmpR family regulator
MATVVLISRHGGLLTAVQQALTLRGHQVVAVSSPQDAATTVLEVEADAAVLSTDVGEKEVARLARLLWARSLPVLFLAGPEERWLPGALPVRPGLDAVVVRPCPSEEVVRALAPLLEARARSDLLPLGSAYFHRPSREVRGPGGVATLTPVEASLVEHLARRRGMTVGARELLREVWGFPEGVGSSELVRAHMHNLRLKLRQVTGGESVIQTVPRQGYRLP